MDAIAELILKLEKEAEKADVDPSSLDETVHDLKSEEATVVNNSGFSGQITYILGQFGRADESGEKYIRELLGL